MGRFVFNLLIILIIDTVAPAQTTIDFISSYNNHIDPFGKLDSIKILKMKIIAEIKYTMNSQYAEMKSEQVCEFFADAPRKCSYTNGKKISYWDMFPVPIEFNGNGIKHQLNYVLSEESIPWLLKSMTDSIVVIEKQVSAAAKHILTFDRKSLNLLQQSTVAEERDYIGYTNFISYQNIHGIVVTKEAALELKFANNVATAIVCYEEVEFQ